MFRVLTCLTGEHDWRLVLLAGLVCFVASIVAINIFHRAIASQTGTRFIWIAIAGAAIGYGIWATHLIAMGAVGIVPDPTRASDNLSLSPAVLAFAIAGVALSVLGMSLIGVLADRRLATRTHKFEEIIDQLSQAQQQVEGSQRELQEQKFMLDTAINNMGEGLCMFDAEKRLVVCNDRYAKMYQLPSELLRAGTSHREIIKHRITNGILKGETSDRAANQLISTLGALPSDAISSRINELADGRLVCVTRQPMAGGGWVATHLDVTEQRRSEAKITYMAQHDALTDLPNRVLLRERLEHALAITRRGGPHLAVLMLDLDRFKEVNDTLGHPAGDTLLQGVAVRLRGCIRETSLIARLGGDEFAVIEYVADPVVEATALAERIRKALCEPFDLGDHQVITGTSIGIAIAPRDGTDSDEILKSADLALYSAKNGGRGSFRFFEPELDQLMHARRNLERDMRTALVNGEFELHYQPFVNVESGEISGCEALLRWHHPQRGLVLPAEFIPLAEETGLIVPLGEWVLRAACAEAAKWPINLKIAINLSPAQFRSKELVTIIVGALATSGIAPQRLELEVTETVIMHDSEAVFAALGQLHRLGVRIALDDFGTGYSSLSFLQKFPFDKIKIDRSFVNELSGAKEESRLIARAVVRFAVSLGKTTTAEGVETKEQLDVLRAEGCVEMQGYYFSRPTHASEVAQMVLAQVQTAANAA
jgi:diguanylate cyclase (GGDEF)-like protein